MLRARKSVILLSESLATSSPHTSMRPAVGTSMQPIRLSKRRLAAARGPDDHGEALARDVEADAVDRRDLHARRRHRS